MTPSFSSFPRPPFVVFPSGGDSAATRAHRRLEALRHSRAQAREREENNGVAADEEPEPFIGGRAIQVAVVEVPAEMLLVLHRLFSPMPRPFLPADVADAARTRLLCQPSTLADALVTGRVRGHGTTGGHERLQDEFWVSCADLAADAVATVRPALHSLRVILGRLVTRGAAEDGGHAAPVPPEALALLDGQEYGPAGAATGGGGCYWSVGVVEFVAASFHRATGQHRHPAGAGTF